MVRKRQRNAARLQDSRPSKNRDGIRSNTVARNHNPFNDDNLPGS